MTLAILLAVPFRTVENGVDRLVMSFGALLAVCGLEGIEIGALLFYRPTGAFSKSRPILPCRISAWNVYRHLLCWLVTYLGLCCNRCGPEIRRAFGNRVELANLLGQLLGQTPAGGLPMRCLDTTETLIWDTGKLQNRFLS